MSHIGILRGTKLNNKSFGIGNTTELTLALPVNSLAGIFRDTYC